MKYFLLLLFFPALLFGQNIKTDSLAKLLKTNLSDTSRINTINELSTLFYFTNQARSQSLADSAVLLSKKIKYKKGQARAYWNIAEIKTSKGKQAEALKLLTEAIVLLENENDVATNYRIYNLIGRIHFYFSNNDVARSNFLKAQHYAELTGDKKLIGRNLNNIGNSYNGVSNDSALYYYTKAYAILEPIHDSSRMAMVSGNIGNMYSGKKMYKLSIEYKQKALNIFSSIKSSAGIAWWSCQLANSYLDSGLYQLALPLYLKSYEMQKANNGSLIIVSECCKGLAIIYEKQNDFKSSTRYYKEHLALKDSIFNTEKSSKLIEVQFNFETLQQEKIKKAEKEKDDAIHNAEIKQQKIIIYSAVAGFILVLGFSVFIFRSYSEKKKANIEITKQKLIVEEKQKEILDSIHYAKRIQQSLLPPEKYIDKSLKRLNKK